MRQQNCGSNMSLSKALEEYIRKLYGELGTQQAVANELGVSQVFVQQLLSGRSNAKNITLGVLEKMFPHATFDLGDGGGNQHFHDVQNSNIANGPQTINSGVQSGCMLSIPEVFTCLTDSIMAHTDLSAADKVRLYSLVTELRGDLERREREKRRRLGLPEV